MAKGEKKKDNIENWIQANNNENMTKMQMSWGENKRCDWQKQVK